MKNYKPILYYDDSCSFCQKGVKRLQSYNANVVYEKLSIAKLPKYIQKVDSLIYYDTKNYYIYSTAVIKTLLRSNKKILGILLLLVPKPIRDFAYKKIAQKRYCFTQ